MQCQGDCEREFNSEYLEPSPYTGDILCPHCLKMEKKRMFQDVMVCKIKGKTKKKKSKGLNL